MNRIVRKLMPASELPEALREGISVNAEVRVTVEVIEEKSHPGFPGELGRNAQTPADIWESIRKYHASPDFKPATDDPVQRIRELRDEWDHR